MSSGSVMAETVGYVFASNPAGVEVYAGECRGLVSFIAAPAKVYPTISEALAALERRAIEHSSGYNGTVTLKRVVERTIHAVEQSYEDL